MDDANKKDMCEHLGMILASHNSIKSSLEYNKKKFQDRKDADSIFALSEIRKAEEHSDKSRKIIKSLVERSCHG